MAEDSIIKLNEILELSQRYGVCTGPLRIVPLNPSLQPIYAMSKEKEEEEEEEEDEILVVPLFSWYHSSFDTESDLQNDEVFERTELLDVPFDRKWGDFYLCSWPRSILPNASDGQTVFTNSTLLAEYFAGLNLDNIQDIKTLQSNGKRRKIITYSHFV